MSSELTSDGNFLESDNPPKKPSSIFLYLSFSSVTLGLALGIFGVLVRAESSESQQYLMGGFGYLLTAFLPIIFFQLITLRHKSDQAANEHEPYDTYAGLKMTERIRKVAAFGLIAASFSIFVFFWPIAESFAS
jgi:hypothetical protein